jgi:hypothetical protein
MMILRILFTLAILAGLAVAPAAQSFSWQAGTDDWRIRIEERTAAQVERALDQASRAMERALWRAARDTERRAEQLALMAAGRAEHRARMADERAERARAMAERHLSMIESGPGSRAFDVMQGGLSDDPCRNSDNRGDRDRYRHCEVREERLPAGPLTVDAGQNGGIRVEAWDQGDILVRAVVSTHAENEAGAKQIASGVQILAGGGRVSSTGPAMTRRDGWSVSYRISVPRQTDLDLHARNGGITIAGVSGTISFDTTNGGVRLSDLGGSVRGETRNGGLNVALSGTEWEGEGIDVETSNGGVTLSIPDNYNAQLETRTVNGGFRFDYPLTLTGELSPRQGINTTIGAGGSPVRVRTTNGGLTIRRR